MARYLRNLSIHLGYNQILPEGISQKDFNITTHVVQDIFLYMLPPRFEFGNILKLNIEIKGENEPLDEVENYGGYANYCYVDFDFEQYFKSSRVEQNRKILEVLREILEKIPVEIKENKKIALGIINKISELNFEYSFETNLSKLQRTKKLKAIVAIRINNEGQNAFLRIENKLGEIILESHLLKNNIYDFRNKLYKSKWVGDTFQIIEREGEIFKSFEIKEGI